MTRIRKREPINEDYRLFGSKIQALRQAHKMTQVELAKELGISKTTLADYEIGLIRIPLSAIKMFAEYFDVSIDELIGLKVSNKSNESKVILTNDTQLMERKTKWYKEFQPYEFTDDEIDEIINYAKYILSKRKK